MGEMIVAMAGTPEGGVLAFALALLSAFAHATFGAINKGGADPYLNRGAINAAYSLMAMPFAVFVFPLPSAAVWQVLALAYLIHLLYEWLQCTAFAKGDFTLVYPIARGTGPLATAIGAVFIFGERLGPVQWAGLALLSASIWGLAAANLRARRVDIAALPGLRQAIGVALMTGGMIAVYTIVDAYGIRLAANPFSFLAWFFVLGGFGFPLVALYRWRRMAPERRPEPFDLAVRGVFGAIIAFVSFGAIMLATRLDKVGEAAALRETSIIFATAIGVLIFRERIDAPRLGLIGLIAAGAMLVEFG
ncbi:MAG: DMT family transporter [Thermohalobaculum sp.]|nr:DMT family transporter [Thermohalobaculum sp.]